MNTLVVDKSHGSSAVRLPVAAVEEIRAIASDLQHLPRKCVLDEAELLIWLRRIAGRVGSLEAIEIEVSVDPDQERAAPRLGEGPRVVRSRSGRVVEVLRLGRKRSSSS